MSIVVGNKVTGYITNSAGRVDFTGTVTHTYRSGGVDTVVIEDANGTEWTARADRVTPVAPVTPVVDAPANIRTHTGMVHAPGNKYVQLRGMRAPKCCASASTVSRYHFITPTSAPVTCKRCLNALAK